MANDTLLIQALAAILEGLPIFMIHRANLQPRDCVSERLWTVCVK